MEMLQVEAASLGGGCGLRDQARVPLSSTARAAALQGGCLGEHSSAAGPGAPVGTEGGWVPCYEGLHRIALHTLCSTLCVAS